MARTEYEFTLILSGIDELTDEVLDRLHEAHCDDALIGMRDGVVFADFARESDSLTNAVLSATRDIESAAIGATVLHVEPDEFVTMAEIARRFDLTRESVRKWVVGARGPGGFPPPIGNLRGKSPLWRWTDVVTWAKTAFPRMRSNAKTEIAMMPDTTDAPQRRASTPDIRLDSAGLAESAADIAALNAAFDLLRYAGPDGAIRLLEAVAARGA
jgi:hypothetical protein